MSLEKSEHLALLEKVKKCGFYDVEHNGITSRTFESGYIRFKKSIRTFKPILKTNKFSFVNLHNEHRIFGGTAIDRIGGGVFAFSCAPKAIILVPKYKFTPENFVRFYLLVTKKITKDAELMTLSEYQKRLEQNAQE